MTLNVNIYNLDEQNVKGLNPGVISILDCIAEFDRPGECSPESRGGGGNSAYEMGGDARRLA